jgi:transposase
MILDQFWLTDAQFSKIAPHLPTDTRGKARVDDRRVISGIVHVLKSGGRWIDAPPEYGPKKTLYNRYVGRRRTPTSDANFRGKSS